MIEGINEPIFGKWYIDEEIGSGAFATVYKIKRESFGTTYYSALKVIHIPQNKNEIKSLRNELGNDKSVSDYYTNFVSDFAKEIELMSELKGNSNIVTIEDHDIIQDSDGIGWTILMRMELLTPFADYQAEHDLNNNDVIKLGIDICSALELCEKRNIIHRDIKPDNIFISKDGDFELGDFGIARELEKTTGGLSKKGTYSYMAPEVYLGKPYNNTVDIYSLGIVMYKLLNHNRAPFMPDFPNPITFSDRETALQNRMRGDVIPDIKDISKEINAVVKKACAFSSKERYQSATEFKQTLISVMNNASSSVSVNNASDFDSFNEKTSGPFSAASSQNNQADTPLQYTTQNNFKSSAEKFDEKTVSPFNVASAQNKQPVVNQPNSQNLYKTENSIGVSADSENIKNNKAKRVITKLIVVFVLIIAAVFGVLYAPFLIETSAFTTPTNNSAASYDTDIFYNSILDGYTTRNVVDMYGNPDIRMYGSVNEHLMGYYTRQEAVYIWFDYSGYITYVSIVDID